MLLEEKLEPEEIEQYEEFNQVIRDLLRPERERIQVNEAMERFKKAINKWSSEQSAQ